jgi:hypothetical protein
MATTKRKLLIAAAMLALEAGCAPPPMPGMTWNAWNGPHFAPGSCWLHEHMDHDGRVWSQGGIVFRSPDGTQTHILDEGHTVYLAKAVGELPNCPSEAIGTARREHQAEVDFARNARATARWFAGLSPGQRARVEAEQAAPIDNGYTTYDFGDGVLRTWSNDQRAGHFHGCDSTMQSTTVYTNCY